MGAGCVHRSQTNQRDLSTKQIQRFFDRLRRCRNVYSEGIVLECSPKPQLCRAMELHPSTIGYDPMFLDVMIGRDGIQKESNRISIPLAHRMQDTFGEVIYSKADSGWRTERPTQRIHSGGFDGTSRQMTRVPSEEMVARSASGFWSLIYRTTPHDPLDRDRLPGFRSREVFEVPSNAKGILESRYAFTEWSQIAVQTHHRVSRNRLSLGNQPYVQRHNQTPRSRRIRLAGS